MNSKSELKRLAVQNPIGIAEQLAEAQQTIQQQDETILQQGKQLLEIQA